MYSSCEAQKLSLLALVCKSFYIPGKLVSVLSINDSVETKTKSALDLLETQFRLSRLVRFVPNVTNIISIDLEDPKP